MKRPQTPSAGAGTAPKVEHDAVGKSLYSLVSLVEGFDQHMLCMCMRAFEASLGLNQSQLSTLMTVSNISRLGCCLIWGLLADKYKLNHVFAAGLLWMGIFSIIQSSTSDYKSIIILRILHGFAFACIYPVQQKIVAEDYSDVSCNLIFGTMQALNCIGSLVCAVVTTRIARQVILGHYGWRTAYVVLGYVWILFGIAIMYGMTRGKSEKERCNAKDKTDVKEVIEVAFSAVFYCKTAGISIFTLFVAETPTCAISNMALYLQYLGVSDAMAGVAVATTMIGCALGSGVGGLIIKYISENYERRGELYSGIAVLVIRLILCLLFFLWKPPCGTLCWYHYMELAAFGGTLVTVGGVDRALLKKAIEDKCQATAAAVIRTISGIASIVILFQISTYLSENVFGYIPSTAPFETMQVSIKHRNAEALKLSMMYIIVAGTILNIFCYVALLCYAPEREGDKGKVK
ncbi:Putative sialic acid transporter [Babesia bigemina]|uniref:Putative sialic acid transporter n=1 Tax=Babesia bigemina TaxID=5866 RepID=A0A061CZC1_BABBI|nr:Putative sialic acid transporter [Babesia bigemina]CDR93768.1 Putative sialic acid transporter [Babesia bigemina]|eukprot:XP_012765954.1 Putative sialic acid transporter [Babesia bigemina]